jgi:hypothetical protein
MKYVGEVNEVTLCNGKLELTRIDIGTEDYSDTLTNTLISSLKLRIDRLPICTS